MRLQHKEMKIMRLLKNYQHDVLNMILRKAQRLENLLKELKEKGVDEDRLIALEIPNKWIEINYETLDLDTLEFFIRELQSIDDENVMQYFSLNHNKESFEVLRKYPEFIEMEILIDKWTRVSKAISDLK